MGRRGGAEMRLLIDTNVVLDVLFARPPFVDAAAAVFDLVRRGDAVGLLGATTITTLFCLGDKHIGAARARREIGRLLDEFGVAEVGRPVLAEALDSGFEDFEDAVLYFAGRRAGATHVVTRDPAGFGAATIPVHSPAELLRVVEGAR